MIEVCSAQRAGQGKERRRLTCTDLCEDRSGACAGDGPAEAEHHTADDESFMERFSLELQFLTAEGSQFQPLNDLHGHDPDRNGRADDEIHVQLLELEHILDAEPADHFCFGEDDTEGDAEENVQDMFHDNQTPTRSMQ